jgi:hypothetical protein
LPRIAAIELVSFFSLWKKVKLCEVVFSISFLSLSSERKKKWFVYCSRLL